MNSQHPDNISSVHMQNIELKLFFHLFLSLSKNTVTFLINLNKLTLEYPTYN